MYTGPQRLELVKILIDRGAQTNFLNSSGSSALMSTCAGEDCDPKVLSLLLKNQEEHINSRRQPCTFKWKFIYKLTRFLVANRLTKSGLFTFLAQEPGETVLFRAV